MLFGWKKIFGYKNSLKVKMLLIFFTLFHSFINSEITLLILSLCLVIAILGIVGAILRPLGQGLGAQMHLCQLLNTQGSSQDEAFDAF